MVSSLLESGTEVNHQNKVTLWTPLHAATFQEHGKVCRTDTDFNRYKWYCIMNFHHLYVYATRNQVASVVCVCLDYIDSALLIFITYHIAKCNGVWVN